MQPPGGSECWKAGQMESLWLVFTCAQPSLRLFGHRFLSISQVKAAASVTGNHLLLCKAPSSTAPQQAVEDLRSGLETYLFCVSSRECVTFHTECQRGEGASKLCKARADFLHVQVNFVCNLSLCWLLAHPQVPKPIKVFERKIKISFPRESKPKGT